MTAEQAQLFDLALICALGVVVLLGAALRGTWGRRFVGLLLLALVGGAWTAWFDLASPAPPGVQVHAHEQYHFFFGSKYLPEVRYDRLYDATVVGLDEVGSRGRIERIRDTMSFDFVPVEEVRARADDTRARFSPERWQAFTADLKTFFDVTRRGPKRFIEDHGNTGSPGWAALALVATGPMDLSDDAMKAWALIDPVLLLLVFLVAWRTVGLQPAAVGLVLALLAVRSEGFIGGSILRMDWLVATALSACLLHGKRYRWAGLLLGYGVATKLFVGAIALAVGLRFVAQAIRDRRIAREHAELVGFAFLGLLLSVLLSSAVFGGLDIWWDYWSRILVTFHEGYYRGQYSFRDLYLQLVVDPGDLFRSDPGRLQASRDGVLLSTPGMWAARVVLVAVLAWVASRHDELTAFAIGVLCVWVLLVTNIYYWQAWLFFGLALARPGPGMVRRLAWLLGVVAINIATHHAELQEWPTGRQAWVGDLGLAWLVVLMVLGEVLHGLWTRRGRRATA